GLPRPRRAAPLLRRVVDLQPEDHRMIRRLLIALAASVAIVLAVKYLLIAGRPTLTVRDIEILEPRWFYLAGLLPYLWLVRDASLTDLSIAQQVLSVLVRSALVLGAALALARPTTSAEDDKVATVMLADVSESISDKQLAAEQAYIDEAFAARKPKDLLYVVTFAERPLVVRAQDDQHAPRIARHPNGGAGTDIQRALELAYGLYPPGYLPRALILSDGNQTSGDLLAEAGKARDFGVHVSWKTFPEDARREIRAVAIHLPEKINVGAPFEVTGEIWSTG